MKTRQAYALLFAMGGIMAAADCGKGQEGAGGGGPGPTDLTVTWTFSGKPASAEECTARKGQKVFVNLSGTVNPDLHQTATEDCAKGSVKFSGLDIETLGMPYLEGRLLDENGKRVTQEGQVILPQSGATNVTLDFFPVQGEGGASASSSSSAASSSVTAAASSSASTSASSSASTSTSTSASGGATDAGADGG